MPVLGDLQATKELADRLDGKPAQMLLEPRDGEPIGRIVRDFVHVIKTQEEIENEDLVVDYREIRQITNGRNGGNGN